MDKTLQFVTWVTAAVGALNWGLVEVFNYNVLTDLMMLSTELEGMAYILIGVAGAMNLYQLGLDFLGSPKATAGVGE